MESRALLLPVSGDARVVRLPGRDDLTRLCTIYDLIGCRYAEVVPLAADVTMWLDEEAGAAARSGGAEPPGHADRGGAGPHRPLCGGPPSPCVSRWVEPASDTQGLSDARLTTLTDLLDRAGVRVVTDAFHGRE